MRFNAGDKKIRDTKWIRIPFLVTGKLKHEIHNWCIKLPGENNGMNKFYHHYSGSHWWFENAQDAVIFKLKWGNYGS